MQSKEQYSENYKQNSLKITNVRTLKDIHHGNDTRSNAYNNKLPLLYVKDNKKTKQVLPDRVSISADIVQFMNVQYLDKHERNLKIDSTSSYIKSNCDSAVLRTPLESIVKETTLKTENEMIVLNNEAELNDYLKSQSKVILLHEIDSKELIVPDILPSNNDRVEVKEEVKQYGIPLLKINIDKLLTGSISDTLTENNEEKDECTRLKYHKLPFCYTDKGKPFITCPVCSAIFFNSSLFQSHFSTHVYKNAENYVCTFCKYSDKDANVLFNHLSIHQNQCENCKVNLASKNNFDRHWSVSSVTFTLKRDRLGRFVCSFCKLIFDFSHQLKKHSFRYSCNERKVHQCSICSGAFTNKNILEDHKCMKCPICNKIFENLQRLKSHTTRMKHSLKCPICPYEFVFASDHQKHLTLHKKVYRLHEYYVHCLEATDGKSFQCELCNKIFYVLSQLILHVYDEHGVKDVIKKFVESQTSQSKLKDKSCDTSETSNEPVAVCWSSQSAATSTVQSVDEATQQNLFQCASCKQLFAGIKSISKHVKMEHAK